MRGSFIFNNRLRTCICLFTALYLLFSTGFSYAAVQEESEAHPADGNGVQETEIILSTAFYQKITAVQQLGALDALVNKNHILPMDYEPTDLEAISVKYSRGAQKLRREARIAFEAFAQAVYDNTKKIPRAVSTFRSYKRQTTVYLRYKTTRTSLESYRLKRDRVSARPGHSEHQLGLAVDVIGCTRSVENTAMYKWYKDHAHEYGFIIRYPKGKEAVTGYLFEPWHLRYLGVELATAVYRSGLCYDEYRMQPIVSPKAG